MEMIALAIGVACMSASYVWWDIAKRKHDTLDGLAAIHARIVAVESRVDKLEEHDLSNRNQIGMLKTFANTRRR